MKQRRFIAILLLLMLVVIPVRAQKPSRLARSKSAAATEVTIRPTRPDATMFVVLYDYTGLDRSMLRRAEDVATEIFNDGGIKSVWSECSVTQECHPPSGGPQFRLAIHQKVSEVVKDQAQTKAMLETYSLGFAMPCARSDQACLFYIFSSPIAALDQQYGTGYALILGHVMVHEIGHALLGPNAHSRRGIMQARLPTSLERYLYFTSEQAARLRLDLLARSRMGSD